MDMEYSTIVSYVCIAALFCCVAGVYWVYFNWWGKTSGGRLFVADWIWIGGFIGQMASYIVRHLVEGANDKQYQTWRAVEHWIGNGALVWFMVLPVARVLRARK